MRAVYLDTSALLPFLDRDDRDHSAVSTAIQRLARERVGLVTTSYTLVEAGALVRSRLGMAAFKALGKAVEQAVEVIWVDQSLHQRAWEKAQSESRRGPSLVDWVGFLAAGDLGIETALALDRHFAKKGFSTLPFGS